MAKIQYKNCLRCGKPYDNQGMGMSQKRFDDRVFCSKSCGNKSRSRAEYAAKREQEDDLAPLRAIKVRIDSDAPEFKFMAGVLGKSNRKKACKRS